MEGLPASVHHLRLRTKQTNGITDRGLKYLPQNLVSLDLSLNMKLKGAGLKYLPPTLRYLTLHGISTLEEDITPYLPSQLEYLDIGGTNMELPIEVCTVDYFIE